MVALAVPVVAEVLAVAAVVAVEVEVVVVAHAPPTQMWGWVQRQALLRLRRGCLWNPSQWWCCRELTSAWWRLKCETSAVTRKCSKG